MDAVGLAVVGSGYWGPNLVRNALAHQMMDLRWVCDLDRAKAERVTRGLASVRPTDELSDVLSDPRVEAIAIATPAPSHSPVALAAVDAGKHVLVEKPLADSLVNGRLIIDKAKDRDLVVMCDHTFCYTGSVIELRRLIHGDHLGAVQYFDSVRINLGLVQSDTNVFWDLAPHDLSILDFILPPGVVVVSVSARGSDPIGIGQACVGHASLTLSNGALAHIHVNWLSPTKVRTTIVGGSKKMVVWNDLDPAQKLSIFDTRVELTGLDEDARQRALVSYRIGDMVAPAINGTEALHNVMGEFAEAIRLRRQPATGGESGLRVLAQLEAIDSSFRQDGAPVQVPEAPRGSEE